MAFEKVQDLDCDVTVSLGGKDKKTGKPNPSKVEGYYLGSRDIPSKFSRTGLAKLYIFETPKGKVGVFGKTDLDRKMVAVSPGTMTRVTQSGSIPTNKGNDMLKFTVEVDLENVIEVNISNNEYESPAASEESYSAADTGTSSEELYEEEAAGDLPEPTVLRPKPPTRAAKAPDAARQARVQALLSGKK